MDTSGVTILDATRDPPKTFREFIEAPPLRGLGEKLSDIERLIADDAESLVRLRELVVGQHGGDRKSENIKSNNITLDSDLFAKAETAKPQADRGTSRAYTLTRLKNERPDLFEKVVAKELTANRAAIEAGWRKAPDIMEVAKRAIGKMNTAQRLEIFRWIANDGESE